MMECVMTTRSVGARALIPAAFWLASVAHGSVLFAAADLRLLQAVQHQDRQAVRTLLQQHVDVNARRGDGVTALAWAVHLADRETVDLLIRGGANVNAANDLGVTPLMLAAVNGDPALVERLLQAKADPNVARSTGETAMVFAARTGKPAVIKALLAAGARADDKTGPRDQTPLMWAAAEGHADAVKLLIEVGANVNAMTKTNQVPAPNGHYVANRPPIERTDKTRSVITILWPKDGDDDMYRYDGGITPLFLAIDGGHQDVVRQLLEAGVKVDGPNPDGLTPLQFAMVRRNEALALFLLDHGADPNNAGPGFPPLHMAAYLNQPAVAKALMARGADINARIEKPYRLIEVLEVGTNRYPGSGLFTNIGSTPFMTAAKHGQTEIMRLLLKAGANPMLTAKGGENALMVAAGLGRPEPSNVTYHVWKQSEQLEAIKICLEVGLDINAQNQWGQTALHGAAFQDFPGIIELLAAEGAWLDPTDWQDQTPLRIAQGHEICCSTFHRMALSAAALLKVGADPNAGVLLKFAAHDYQDDTVKTDAKEAKESKDR
jgi:ankyrin repeat protein